MPQSLHDGWSLGGVPIPNRLVLAPLAGIGNWFVRLQARRYGAGLAVSEMVSSFAIHHHNQPSWRQLLRLPAEQPPSSLLLCRDAQELAGAAAAAAAAAGAGLVQLTSCCPPRR